MIDALRTLELLDLGISLSEIQGCAVMEMPALELEQLVAVERVRKRVG